MRNERRTIRLLAFCVIGPVLALCSCQSCPGIIDTGAVIDTQSDVAQGAATVEAGAAGVASGAAGLAATLGGMAQENPALAPVAEQAAFHAVQSATHAVEARELRKAVDAARAEVVALIKKAALIEGQRVEEREGRLKAEGQRNTAWMALAGIAAVAGIFIFLKVKRILF